MHLIDGQDAAINGWLAQRFGVEALATPRLMLGCIDGDGVLRGAFVIVWRSDTTAELSLFGRTSGDTWKAMFARVFGSGVHRLEIRTAKSNRAIRRAAPKFGFAFEGRATDYYGPGEHALQFFMTPDRCRWLRGQDVIAVQIA